MSKKEKTNEKEALGDIEVLEENMKFYTCKFDRPFKEVFLDEKNEDLLRNLLENVLRERIKHIEYKPTERNAGNIKIRRKTLDALVTTENRIIGIEVNANCENYVHPRNMAFISDVYAHQTLVGENYTEDIEIMQINFTYGLSDDKPYRIYTIQDAEGKKFVKNFKIYEINMDYYKEIWNNKDTKAIEENKYLVMLDLEPDDLRKLSRDDKVVQKYMEKLNKVNQDPVFREYMSKEEDDRKIRNTFIKEGLEQGIAQGIEQGIKQGFEKGAKETSIEIVKNMLKDNIPLENISKYTKLPIDELNNLVNETK